MPTADYRELRVLMAPDLPAGIVDHIDRVVVVASELATAHGADVPRAQLAAQGHDLLRGMSDEAWLEAAEVRSLEVRDLERAHPVLLHGPLGALELAARGWVDDPAVLEAIRWHTTGHPDYDAFAWCMFIADKIEPDKMMRWPALQAVSELADDSLEEAALLYLELNRRKSARQGSPEHPMATEVRRFLRSKVGPAAS